jgi:putative RNase toxin 44 of polymorphic toxin system
MRVFLVVLFIASFFLISSHAQAANCTNIDFDDGAVFTLAKYNYQANNCFTVNTSATDKKMFIHVFDHSQSPYTLRLEHNGNSTSWASEVWNPNQVNNNSFYETSASSDSSLLTFYIDASIQNTNKEIEISAILINGYPQLVIQAKNLVPPPPPPPVVPICNPAVQICNILQSFSEPVELLNQSVSSGFTYNYQLKPGESFYTNTETPGNQSNCTALNSPPTMPDAVNMNENIQEAQDFGELMENLIADTIEITPEEHLEGSLAAIEMRRYLWAYNFFDDNQAGDPKANYSEEGDFEDFGNFQYGAMMLAAGISPDLILRGSAGNQNANSNFVSDTGSRLVDFGIGFFFGDESTTQPVDVIHIEAGMDYYEEVFTNDPNSSSVSDSCDPNNGASSGGFGTGGGEFDDLGGYHGGWSWRTGMFKTFCEIWHYFDPWGNYAYSVERNCRTYFIPY